MLPLKQTHIPARFSRAVLGLLLMAAPVMAMAEVKEADQTLAQQVFKRLLTVAPAQHDIPWPPALQIFDKKEVNAYATIKRNDDKRQALVICYNGLMQDIAAGDADRLAYILGHET